MENASNTRSQPPSPTPPAGTPATDTGTRTTRTIGLFSRVEVAACLGFTVIGGGDSAAAIRRLGVDLPGVALEAISRVQRLA